VVTNTGHYVELEAGGQISRIATMRVVGPNGPVDRFGGTAIARAERADLNTYADLRGKRLAVPDTHGFGGWQVHLREARKAGIELAKDVAEILELQAQDRVVASVIAGRSDIGFVRSDLIEAMAAAGKLDLSKLKVIGEHSTAGYPYRHSTQLYPHWPFAKLDHVPDEVTKDLLIALLSLPPDHPAARAAGIHGWTLPQNYQSIHDLFLEFRLGPYADLPVELSDDHLSRYGQRAGPGGSAVDHRLLLTALWWISRSQHGAAPQQRPSATGRRGLRTRAGRHPHRRCERQHRRCQRHLRRLHRLSARRSPRPQSALPGLRRAMLPEFYRAMWQDLLTKAAPGAASWSTGARTARATCSRPASPRCATARADPEFHRPVERHQRAARIAEPPGADGLFRYADRATQPQDAVRSPAPGLGPGQPFRKAAGVCYLDLDEFKAINDTVGPRRRRPLLIDASRRLLGHVRAGDTVSRLGGDEFVAAAGNAAASRNVKSPWSGYAVPWSAPSSSRKATPVSCSMGVTLFPMDGADPDMLLRHADQAMYLAKQGGRNRFTLFDAEHDRISEMRRESRRAFRRDRQQPVGPALPAHRSICATARWLAPRP
jgi:diguanylate cyclase (GGDEF)-like protein